MKKILIALVLACASLYAQPPSCITIQDTLYSMGQSGNQLMTGFIQLSLGYFTSSGGFTITQSLTTLTINAKANNLSTCITPSVIVQAQYTVTTGGRTPVHYATYWYIPNIGGPYQLTSVPSGLVNTSGTPGVVTWVSGLNFANVQANDTPLISGAPPVSVSSVQSVGMLTLYSGVGTLTSAAFSDGPIERVPASLTGTNPPSIFGLPGATGATGAAGVSGAIPAIPNVTLDANCQNGFRNGGGSATDNTVAINAYIGAATATSAVTATMTGCTVDSGILIPPTNGNVTITGCGFQCGFFTKTGSNAFSITNATRSTPPWIPFDPGQFAALNPGTPALVNTGSVILSHFSINGNRGSIGANTGNVSGTLSTPFGIGSCYSGGAPTHPEQGYCTLSPPGSPNIGNGAFPSMPTSGQWAVITNGVNGLDCSTRSGAFIVACYWSGSSWLPGGGGTLNSFPWYTNVDLNSLNYVRLSDLLSIDSPTYGFRIGNVNNVVGDNLTCIQSGTISGNAHDCFHVDGPASNVLAHNITCVNIDDDCVAFNVDEGYGGAASNLRVDGVKVTGVGVGDFVNLAGLGSNAISDPVLIGGLQGYGVSGVRILGDIGALVQISDSNFSGNAFFNDQASSIPKITVQNSQLTPNGGSAAFVCYNSGTSIAVGEIELGNISLGMNSGVSSGFQMGNIATGCSVQKLTINGAELSNASGASYGLTNALQVDGTLNELVINSFNPRWFTNFINASSGWTNISRISGSGLVAMGFPVPDAKVVNNIPYISADNASNPIEIKIGGTPGGIDGTPTQLAMLGNNSSQLGVPFNQYFYWVGSSNLFAGCNGCFGAATSNLADFSSFNSAAASFSSGFGVSPVVIGKASMGSVNVGTGGAATSGVISLATGGSFPHYYCIVQDVTTPAKNTVTTCMATSSTITFNTTSAWNANDVLTWFSGGSN
jgi:hypothetical protein